MEVELPTAREDVDQMWSASRTALSYRPPEEKEHRDAATKQADHDRNSRTNVVLAWVGTNMSVLSSHETLSLSHALDSGLILIFTSRAFTDWVKQHVTSTSSNFNPYLTFLFYCL